MVDSSLPPDLQARNDEATVAKAEADAAKPKADAIKAAADSEAARRAGLTALLPDLSKVKDSTSAYGKIGRPARRSVVT